jgi:hypothetical protein
MIFLFVALSCGGPPGADATSSWGGKPGFAAPSVVQETVSQVEEDSAAVQIQVKAMSIQAANQVKKMDKLIAELKKQ